MTEKPDSEQLPEAAPIFPLPDLVFFPHTILPLHIFEDRYREMTAKALEADGYIAMTLLRPGSEALPEGVPSYYRVGCLGRISEATKTEDGRYHLNLVGLKKVALGEMIGEKPYITARIRLIEESTPAEGEEGSHAELVRLLGTCTVLIQELSETTFPLVSVEEGLPYETVVNSICFHLGLPAEVKQSLLEENDVRERCRRLTRFVEEHLQRLLIAGEDDSDGDDAEQVH
jgi:Lon protease-like protein